MNATEQLVMLAELLDMEAGPVPLEPVNAQLVRVAPDGVALRELEDHPFSELVGFVAPDDWQALGVVSGGWATSGTTGERRRSRVIHIVDRHGNEVGLVRQEGDAEPFVRTGLTPGKIADCLRIAMGVENPPLPDSMLRVVWAHRVLAAITAHNGDVDELVAAKLITETEVPAETWDAERWRVVDGSASSDVMDATVAAWCDAGLFARLVMGALPDTEADMEEAKANCTPSGWKFALNVLLLALNMEELAHAS